jgi:zinc transport system ATP-binding protein
MSADTAPHDRTGTIESSPPALVGDGIWFSYGSVPVLEDVGFQVAPGEFVALVGPNGSGKTTLLKILLGLLGPVRGAVRVLGSEPHRLEDRWRVGYVPQRPELGSEVPATVEEVVATGRLARRGWWRRLGPDDRAAVEHALGSVALLDHRSLPVNALSGGEQQRAFIARAFAGEPDLLILDEPIAGIDRESQERFRDSLHHLIEEHGTAILLVSHELGAVARDLDRVLVLRRRILFDGTPQELAAGGVSLGVHREDLPLWLEGLG